MAVEWHTATVTELQREGVLLVEDGNHGEYRPRPDEFVDSGVAFIRAADMNDGRVLFESAAKINERARQRITKGIGAPGDILLSHKGTVGKVALVPDHAPAFVCSPQTTFWRTRDERRLDRKYLYSFLRSPVFHAQLATRAAETDMAPYVSLTSQRGLSVTLPPLPEQRAIAHILGTLDDKIELNRRMSETLDAMARALFKSWFVDFNPVRAKAEGRDPGLPQPLAGLFPARLVDSDLGEIPEGWALATLGEHMVNFDSKRVPVSGSERANRKGPFPYHGAAGVMDYVDDYLFDGIYLLVGEDGSVVGDSGRGVTQYVWGRLWVNNHAHVLQGKGAVSTEQLYLYFDFEPVAPYVTGAVQPKLSQGRMNMMPFVFAGENVCHAFRDLSDPWFAKLRSCAEETRTLTALRDTLLPKLISGELRVKAAKRSLEGVSA
jgi:type I restriction enzyme, S subunit